MKTYCAWCGPDAPPMHDDGNDADTRLNHGICQPHLFAMRAKLDTTCPGRPGEKEEEPHDVR